ILSARILTIAARFCVGRSRRSRDTLRIWAKTPPRPLLGLGRALPLDRADGEASGEVLLEERIDGEDRERRQDDGRRLDTFGPRELLPLSGQRAGREQLAEEDDVTQDGLKRRLRAVGQEKDRGQVHVPVLHEIEE